MKLELKKIKTPRAQNVDLHESVAGLFIKVVPQAMRVFREEMRTHRGGDISVPQFRVLAQLWLEPASNKDLASRLGVSGAAMTRMVDALVNEDLVTRHLNKKDRRSIFIRLTKKGQTHFEKVREAAILSLAERLRDLDSSIVHQMGEGLGLVFNALSKLQVSNFRMTSDSSFDR